MAQCGKAKEQQAFGLVWLDKNKRSYFIIAESDSDDRPLGSASLYLVIIYRFTEAN